jgi:hypothetical protein
MSSSHPHAHFEPSVARTPPVEKADEEPILGEERDVDDEESTKQSVPIPFSRLVNQPPCLLLYSYTDD